LLAELSLLTAEGEEASFEAAIAAHGHRRFSPTEIEYFQMNLGKLCNMTCRHCHVDAGPDRWDQVMSDRVVAECLQALDRTRAHTVDLTGGAPELHPRFAHIVEQARARGKHVIDRCNLTVLLIPRYRDLPRWLADHEVEVVCSLPHFRRRNTDAQRGEGSFDQSIAALHRLNQAGYGQGDLRRKLTLMTNPAGAFLAGNQKAMEPEWKTALARDHGVTFDSLITLNNLPIARFLEWLQESDNFQEYMELLVNSFNPDTIAGLMCRNTISISWQGRVYACDFNQMLHLECQGTEGEQLHIRDFDPVHYRQHRIATARHCFGCTAGAGSSCGGALAD
jgi:radical SAM/Cys-rich protein